MFPEHHSRVNNSIDLKGGENLAFCLKCGSALPESARFYPSCGTVVGKVATEEFSVSSEDSVGKVKQLIHEEK